MSERAERSAIGKNRATCCSFPERRAVTAGCVGLVFKLGSNDHQMPLHSMNGFKIQVRFEPNSIP